MQTYFMKYTIPISGASQSYVTNINDAFSTIDSHDHYSIGNYINQNSITWEDIDFQNYYISECKFYNLYDNNITISSTLYCLNGDLYYNDGNSNVIRITLNSALDIIGSYDGFFGDSTTTSAACYVTDLDAGVPYYTFYTNQDSLFGTSSFTLLTCGAFNCSGNTNTITNVVVNTSLSITSQTLMVSDSIFPNETSIPDTNSFFINGSGRLTNSYFSNVPPTLGSTGDFSFLNGSTGNYTNKINYLYAKAIVWTFPANYMYTTVPDNNACSALANNSRFYYENTITQFSNQTDYALSTTNLTPFPINYSSLIPYTEDTTTLPSYINVSQSYFYSTIISGLSGISSIYPSFNSSYNPLFSANGGDTNTIYFSLDMGWFEKTIDVAFRYYMTPIWVDYQVVWQPNSDSSVFDASQVVIETVFEQFWGPRYGNIENESTVLPNIYFIGLRAYNHATGSYLTNFLLQFNVFYYLSYRPG